VRVGEGVVSLSVEGALLAGCIGSTREELGVDVLGLSAISNASDFRCFQAGQVG